jgi:hypothetical protein
MFFVVTVPSLFVVDFVPLFNLVGGTRGGHVFMGLPTSQVSGLNYAEAFLFVFSSIY